VFGVRGLIELRINGLKEKRLLEGVVGSFKSLGSAAGLRTSRSCFDC
jgi:hypothetical protein